MLNRNAAENNTPVDLEDDDDNEEKEAEAAPAVLVEQGKEAAVEAGRAPSSILVGLMFGCLNEHVWVIRRPLRAAPDPPGIGPHDASRAALVG